MATQAYRCGQLFAVLAQFGYAAPVERLYGKVSLNPVALVPLLTRATAGGTDEQRDILLPIMAELSPAIFARSLTVEQQGDFAIGYYHQRGAFRRGLLPALDQDEPPADERYELRMDADLKAWTKAHGGDKLIRALLRQVRADHKDGNGDSPSGGEPDHD